jgi:hypothetical protein
MNLRSRRPVLPEYPDFGMAKWDTPDRNTPFCFRFYINSFFNHGRFRQISGTVYCGGKPYALTVRTQQPEAAISAAVTSGAKGVRLVNGRIDSCEIGPAAEEFRPLSGWVEAENTAG